MTELPQSIENSIYHENNQAILNAITGLFNISPDTINYVRYLELLDYINEIYKILEGYL